MTDSTSQEDIKKYLQDYAGIVIQDPNVPSKFICVKCHRYTSYGVGKWGYFESHLNTTVHKNHHQEGSETETTTVHKKQHQEGSKTTTIRKKKHQEESGSESEEEKDPSATAAEILANNTLRTSTYIEAKSPERDLLIRYTEFILENRLPFALIEPLIDFTKEIVSHYDIDCIKKAKMSRTTLQKITKDCIAKDLKSELFAKLSTSPFSLSLDETTDLYGASYLAVFAKFLEKNNYKEPVTRLITIIPIEDSSTGEVIYKKIKREVLISEQIRQNLLGIVTDEGGNMAGKYKGISSRLKDDYKYILATKDFSHLYNTVYKWAKKAFPKPVRHIIKSIASHFSHSTQKKAKFFEKQKEMELEPLAILHFIKTRWLSLRNCLKRILDRWEALKVYFVENAKQEELAYFTLKNEIFLRVFYLFTEKMNYYNEWFQKDHIYYAEIINKIKEGYVIFSNYILNAQNRSLLFDEIYKIPFDKEKSAYNNLLDSLEGLCENVLYKDSYIKEKLSTFEKADRDQIASAAQNFVLTCLKTMRVKLPFQNEIISDANVIFLREFSKKKWEALGNRYTNIITSKDELNLYKDEIGRLEYNFADIQYMTTMTKMTPLEVWKTLEENYPITSKLASALFVLPHSTATVERSFSTMKDIKNPKRNRLTVENLEACLLSYQHFKTEDKFFHQTMMEGCTEILYPLQRQSQETTVLRPQEQGFKTEEEEGIAELLTDPTKYVRELLLLFN